MKINNIKKRIELTEVENKKACIYGTDEYKDLVSMRHTFSDYSIYVVKNKNKRTDSLKGLTYAYMEAYIEKHGSPQQINEFKYLRGSDDGLSHLSPSYGEIKKWFLSQFPEILEYSQKINSILRGEVA
ncbi:MAG: hypothetical protein E7607_04620 [Ruminococcaceae bacterium]|nr:hypothetical protein [Oscillospiraceae bacterium]